MIARNQPSVMTYLKSRRRQQRVTDHMTDRVIDLVTDRVTDLATNRVTDRMTHHHMTSSHPASHMTSARQYHVTNPRRRQRRQVQQRRRNRQRRRRVQVSRHRASVRHYGTDQKHSVYTEQTCIEGSEAVLKSEQRRRQR